MEIKTYYPEIIFDIYRPIVMEQELGNHADIIIGLLEEDYGYKIKSPDDKYRIVVRSFTQDPETKRKELETALQHIFNTINKYKEGIKDE